MTSLSPVEAKEFYDRFGSRQDQQGFYEDAALDRLIRFGDFASSRRVFELGCGTGRLSHRLLSRELPDEASYVGVDVSSTMIALARERLAPFDARVELIQTEGSMSFDFPDASFDRFVSTYVLDLLPAFGERDAEALWVHPADHHPNEEAHALAARALGEFLGEQGLVGAPAS